MSALLVIDVQNDFIDGTLAIRHCPAGQEGAEVVPVINGLLDTVQFDVVIYSLDWHPPNHISFVENKNEREIHKTSKVWGIFIYLSGLGENSFTTSIFMLSNIILPFTNMCCLSSEIFVV